MVVGLHGPLPTSPEPRLHHSSHSPSCRCHGDYFLPANIAQRPPPRGGAFRCNPPLPPPPSPLPPLLAHNLTNIQLSPPVPRARLAPLLAHRNHRLDPQRPARMHDPPRARRSRLNPCALLGAQRSAEGLRHTCREPHREGRHAGEDARPAAHEGAAGLQADDCGCRGSAGSRADAGAADGCGQLCEGELAPAWGRGRRGLSRRGRDGAAV